MSVYYIAGIVKEEDGSGYSAYFPDVPSVCAGGETVNEAIENATDGLYEAVRGMLEDQAPIPEPSNLEQAKKGVREWHSKIGVPCPDDAIYQFIPAPELDMAPVRVNITVPKSILAEIDRNAKQAGMSRSGFLVAAARAYCS